MWYWCRAVLKCVILFHRLRVLLVLYILFFFFKQKTAYEMRISDWSSDVCSSDLPADHGGGLEGILGPFLELIDAGHDHALDRAGNLEANAARSGGQIGRASCRERVCQYV